MALIRDVKYRILFPRFSEMDSDIRQSSKNIKFLTYRKDFSESARMGAWHSVSNSFPVFRCIGSICENSLTRNTLVSRDTSHTRQPACAGEQRWHVCAEICLRIHPGMFTFLDSAPRLAGSSEYHYSGARRCREHRPFCLQLRAAPPRLRHYRSHPFRGDRDYLNKAIYVTYHGQDNSRAIHPVHGVSRRRVLPNGESARIFRKKQNAKKEEVK